MKGRSIQDNLHLVREVLEGLKDDAKAVLINLDQSKAFDRVDHRFLATVLETAGFKPDQHVVTHHPGGGAGEQGAFGGVHARVVGPVGLHPVTSSLCLCFGAPAPYA